MLSFFNILLFYGVAINVVTFFLFGWDKYRAKSNGRRVSEKNLLLSMVFGGVLGALFGQTYFRHKTTKGSFVWKFWTLVVVWMVLILLLMIYL